MTRIGILLICIFLFTIGCSKNEVRQFQQQNIPPKSQENNSNQLNLSSLDFSKEFDRIGFFANNCTNLQPIDKIAHTYNASYLTIPNLYEIKNIHFDHTDARLWIQTEYNRIKQVTLLQVYAINRYKELYTQIVAEIGLPDILYAYDEYYNLIETDIFEATHTVSSIWHFNGHVLELGVNPPGNMERGLFLASYTDKRDTTFDGAFYEAPSFCCPHENNWSFAPNCIFLDEDLFQEEASVILSKYWAEPACENEIYCKYINDSSNPYIYIIDDLICFDLPSTLRLSGRYYLEKVCYSIDVSQQELPNIKYIFHSMCEEIQPFLTAKTQNFSSQIFIDEQFNPNCWESGYELRYEAPITWGNHNGFVSIIGFHQHIEFRVEIMPF